MTNGLVCIVMIAMNAQEVASIIINVAVVIIIWMKVWRITMSRTYSLTKNSDELKKLILENPDLPIVILANEDSTSGDWSWTYCSSISFGIGEILDCDFYDYNDTVFTDRDRLEEYIGDMLYDEYHDKPEEEYEKVIKDKLAELEPYWKKVIAIYATN